MVDAPGQNWTEYERRAAPYVAAWLRSMTADERLSLYDDMFGLISNVPRESAELERLEKWRWQKKVARRQVEINAYQRLDKLRRERVNPNDAR